MAGVYVHIPYCSQACSYCDFYFSTSRKSEPAFWVALVKELNQRMDYFPTGTQLDSLYFGGGTPGLPEAKAYADFFKQLAQIYPLKTDAEVTLEVNPENITADKLQAWSDMGINRLSIGAQAFQDSELAWMNRSHTAEEAIGRIQLSQAAGFDNLSVDLIYATPTLQDADWAKNIDKLIDLGIPHISAYALTVEPKTLLAHEIQKGQMPPPEDAVFERQFDMLVDRLTQAGYTHYEISNFAKAGFQSRHNSSYWTGTPYLGLGPSAHGFDGSSRYANSANVWKYIEAIESGKLAETFVEVLTPTQRFNERVMLGLRQAEGVTLSELQDLLPDIDWAAFQQTWQDYIQADLMQADANRLCLTTAGRKQADGIAAEFFVTDGEALQT